MKQPHATPPTRFPEVSPITGRDLCRRREALGLHRGELAALLHIHYRALQYREEGRSDGAASGYMLEYAMRYLESLAESAREAARIERLWAESAPTEEQSCDATLDRSPA